MYITPRGVSESLGSGWPSLNVNPTTVLFALTDEPSTGGGESGWREAWIWTKEWLERIFQLLIDLLTTLAHTLHIDSHWPAKAFMDSYHFVQSHPHTFHILFWTIFFGPIIVLLPALILIEVTTLLLYNVSFISHGQWGWGSPKTYDLIKECFIDTREQLFVYVERTGNTYNKWTSAFLPLMVLRLVAGALALGVMAGIWSGW